MAVQVANFQIFKVSSSDVLLYGNSSAFADLSIYGSDAQVEWSNDPTDQTTFGATGNSTAENITRGAKDGRLSMKLNFEPAVNDWLNKVLGNPTGFTFIGYTGTNATPAVGDEVFLMSALCLTAPLQYNTGALAVWSTEAVPLDAGLYAPGYYRY